MNTLQFVGLPLSGKSLLLTNIKKNSKRFVNSKILIINFLYQKKKINIFEYLYWSYLFSRTDNVKYETNKRIKKNKHKIRFKIFIYNLFLPSYNNILKKIFTSLPRYEAKYLQLFNHLNYLSKKYNADLSKVIQTIKIDIIAYEISKNEKKYFLLNSESIYQRALSILFRIPTIDSRDLKIYLDLCPRIDRVFIIINKNIKKNNLIDYIRIINPEFFFNDEIIKKIFFIFKYLHKNKFVKNIIYFKNLDDNSIKLAVKSINDDENNTYRIWR